jgi:prepilin-type N-terminal cleavage/methylation domain-containing protein
MRNRLFAGKDQQQGGFTLLEVIVALIVASIVGTLLVSFLGSNVMQSGNPVIFAQNGAYLNQIMENMGAEYKSLMATSASPMTTFIANVGAEGSSQTRYADANHPYTVVHNHRISFPSGSPATEQADGAGKILKVTIAYRSLSVTSLYTE